VIVLGIDPGLSGALAVVDTTAVEVLSVHDMPVFAPKKGKRTLDLHELVRIVSLASVVFGAETAAIEDVHTRPVVVNGKVVRGVVSEGQLMEAFGAAKGIVVAVGYRLHLARPSQWKPALGLTKDKALSRRKASLLFPGAAHYFARVKDDGRAEAALLAMYGAALENDMKIGA
jgi:crossover junction endodeoxyribonuclease RuvC